MDVLVQRPREIRPDIVSSCDHGWVNDKVDSGMKGNLMEDVGRKFVDDLVLLLPVPLDKCDDYCHSLEEPEDIKSWKDEEIDGDIVKPVSDAHPISLSLLVVKKIKSAMKGSRQEHGREKKTLSVSWAPDVYDPPVTSQCHLVKPNSQKHSRLRKKSSKHKQKGKPFEIAGR